MAESDSVIRLRELDAGAAARVANKSRSSCPHPPGLERTWWLKGYDRPHLPATPIVCATAKVWPRSKKVYTN